MNVTVAGLWHLGCVTSVCCARYFNVVGVDDDIDLIQQLNRGNAPVFEPSLNELLGDRIATGRLRFTDDYAYACAEADVLWVTYDTPVNDQDQGDVDVVLSHIRRCVAKLPSHAGVLISSQLPVGSCRRLEAEFPGVSFAYSPENLQLGKAIASFETAARIVVGCRDGSKKGLLCDLLTPFCQEIMWMCTESAEMVKHGLNAFLGLSITYINEIAALCEKTGADAQEVSLGLKSDVRIGPKAYLTAGSAFAGGTLARDIVSMLQLSDREGVRLDVIAAIKSSNDWHRGWALRKLQQRLGNLAGQQIGILGLTYKAGTNTLRRSSALELAHSLFECSASVKAFDPAISHLDDQMIQIVDGVSNAVEGSDAVVICTDWPVFRSVDWVRMLSTMNRPLVIDANRFLEKEMTGTQVEYLSVGRV